MDYFVCKYMKEKYPDGKLKADDEGSLTMAIFVKDGRLVIDFGKDLSWIGFDKASLANLIEMLKVKYETL